MAHVVVIDDEDSVAEVCAMILRMGGHNVAIAHNGEAGLHLIREMLPDVVVCDLRMPGIDGHQLVLALKSQPSTTQIPVLLMSGHCIDEKKSCDAFIAKPFCVPELLAMVQRLATRGGE